MAEQFLPVVHSPAPVQGGTAPVTLGGALTMAMYAIHEVGSDGNYIGHDHTLDDFRQLWRPSLFSRLSGKAWTKAESRRLGEVLRKKTISIMESHKPEPLPDRIWNEIDNIFQNPR